MIRYINRGPEVTIQDPLHPGQYKKYKDLNWQGMPEIISFTDYLRWNYTLNYGMHIRKLHAEHVLPIPYTIKPNSKILNVTIVTGKYDRVDYSSFLLYVICDVFFNCDGNLIHQEYCVSGYFRMFGSSDFFNGVELYNGKRIRCQAPLDEFLVPIMSKSGFDVVAAEILDKYYNKEYGYNNRINGKALAEGMGYTIQYLRLSVNGNLKSKLIIDRKDVVVYDSNGHPITMLIPARTILVDKSLIEDTKLDNVIIHECVHIYLHNLFYYAQSLYRSVIGKEAPEFLDYFYSETQKDCIRWMETQANSIARHIQMPRGETTDFIIDFIDRYDEELNFDDYRELIDMVKNRFGVSRYAAKKRIIELGWIEVRGVYTYCTTGYVDDHEIESRLPANQTYTLPLRCIAQIFGESKEFATLASSRRYIYIDGHMCRNDEKYVIKEYGVAFGLTEYAKHNMSECCISFKQIYGKQEYSYTYGELNKEDLRIIVEHTLDSEQKKKLRRAMDERKSEGQKLGNKATTNPLGEAVKFHMKRCKVTSDILADRSGLGIATITKLRNGKKVKLETILAFSVALELEKTFILDLVQKANLSFDAGNPAHNMYLTILELLPDANVFQINEFLKEEGFTPWTQERELKQEKAVL